MSEEFAIGDRVLVVLDENGQDPYYINSSLAKVGQEYYIVNLNKHGRRSFALSDTPGGRVLTDHWTMPENLELIGCEKTIIRKIKGIRTDETVKIFRRESRTHEEVLYADPEDLYCYA